MSSMLPDDAWVNCFLPTPPRPLLSALERRLHTSTTHLNALAEIYRQRAIIESTYAESLAKLAKTAEQGGLSGKSGNEWEKASGEGRLWDALVSELAETSASHSTLSALLKTDFEQPIREMPSKIVSWRRIGEQDASLDKTLKDYEKTSAKLEKASSKSKSSKADALQSELNNLTSSLSSLSPMVYTTFQRVDEERLRTLKEVIVRWGTVKGDMAARDGQRAEAIVATLLSWETDEEVLSIGRKLGAIGGGRVQVLDSATTTPRSNRRLSSVTTNTNNNSNDFSPRPQQPRANGSSSNLSNAPSAFGGGLKSMLGRTKTMSANRTRSGSNATSTRSGRDRDGAFEAIGESAPRTGSAPPVDDEGFSVAPSDRHRNPWEDPNELVPTPVGNSYAQQVTASPAQSQESLPSSIPPPQPKLSLAIAPEPIQESEEERQAALQKMQQTLQMPSLSQPTRRSTIARGRRDVRNTVFAGVIGENGTIPNSSLGSLVEPPEEQLSEPSTANGHAEKPGVARQTSLSSVHSNNPFDSPGLMSAPTSAQPIIATSPGLRASLHESVNVVIRDKEVQRIQITGEIHLSLQPMQQTPTGPIHLRLTQFERLEKIAPNPAYLAQVPDRPGEYFLNSEVLAAATAKGSDKGTLLFKYVVHVQPGKETTTAPLILEPAFLCKSGETRMILHYRVNEAAPLQLTNVSIVAAFGPGPSVTNVQAKPAGGVWSPATRRMQWKLDQLPSTEGKIIAKFVTEQGEAMSPQGVQASWGAEGTLMSGLGVEVVGGELEGHGWVLDDVRKSVIAGKYLAEPSVST